MCLIVNGLILSDDELFISLALSLTRRAENIHSTETTWRAYKQKLLSMKTDDQGPVVQSTIKLIQD